MEKRRSRNYTTVPLFNSDATVGNLKREVAIISNKLNAICAKVEGEEEKKAITSVIANDMMIGKMYDPKDSMYYECKK